MNGVGPLTTADEIQARLFGIGIDLTNRLDTSVAPDGVCAFTWFASQVP
jgi:hypothetical protein